MSMIDGSGAFVTKVASFSTTTSSGCSNMLNERLHCLRGRIVGCEFLRTDAADGDPFPRTWLLLLPNGGLRRELLNRLPVEWFFNDGRSLWGDSQNRSSNDADALSDVLFPRL